MVKTASQPEGLVLGSIPTCVACFYALGAGRLCGGWHPLLLLCALDTPLEAIQAGLQRLLIGGPGANAARQSQGFRQEGVGAFAPTNDDGVSEVMACHDRVLSRSTSLQETGNGCLHLARRVTRSGDQGHLL